MIKEAPEESPLACSISRCFDLFFQGERCGSSWARMSALGSRGWEIECRQIMLDVEAVGIRSSRRQSHYCFDAQGDLTSALIHDHFGNHLAVSVKADQLIVGDQRRPLEEPINFVLESNMVALSAVQLEQNMPHGAIKYRAFLPETGACIPYELTLCDDGHESSLGERYGLDRDRRIVSLRLAQPDFECRRGQRAFPKWSLTSLPPRFIYHPPDTIRVQEKQMPFGASTKSNWDATLVRHLGQGDPIAAAVFVGGSGVYNRHGFTPSFDIGYHQLLDDLAAEGIASVRYEKFDPTAVSLDEAEGKLGFDELSENARAWMAWLDNQRWAKTIPKILIGHSLGGLVALELSRRETPLDMIVLLSTPGRTFRQVTKEQHGWFLKTATTSRLADRESDHQRREFIKALESKDEWTPENVDGWILAQKRVRKLYRSILDMDPCEMVSYGQCPILIVQGTADVQVANEDAARLVAACERAQRPHQVIYAAQLDHLLKKNSKTGFAALNAYADRRRRIPIALIRQIAKAIKAVVTH